MKGLELSGGGRPGRSLLLLLAALVGGSQLVSIAVMGPTGGSLFAIALATAMAVAVIRLSPTPKVSPLGRNVGVDVYMVPVVVFIVLVVALHESLFG